MIHADLHGKLSPDGFNAHSRSEDLLTSTVFGLLRYLPIRSALVPLVGRARPVCLDGDLVSLRESAEDLALCLSEATSCDLEFWPRAKFGEPDLLLTFRDASHEALHRVVIEAKLHSGKSSTGELEDVAELQASGKHPDQLVNYWQGHVGTIPHTLIYLTPPPAPISELRESLAHAPDMNLAWLSWRDVWEVVQPLVATSIPPHPAIDLSDLLSHRGYRSLNAFRSPGLQVPRTGRFWGRRWFAADHPFKIPLSPQRFWRTQ